MFYSILYKEWLKLRRYWVIAFIFNVAVMVYLFIDLRHLFAIEHAEMIWYQAFEIGTIHYLYLKYISAITGIIIGTAQFVPEMIGHRFRLSLHLPVRPSALVILSVSIGLTAVAIIGLADLALLYGTIRQFYPCEAAVSAILTVLPWQFAGLIIYMGIALVALEPQLIRRLVYLAIACSFACLFYQGNDYECYNRLIWKMFLVSSLFIPSVLLPAYRYRSRSS